MSRAVNSKILLCPLLAECRHVGYRPKADIRIKEWSCPYGQKNSSSLGVSEKLNLFNGNEFKEGTTFRLFPPHGLMYTYPSR